MILADVDREWSDRFLPAVKRIIAPYIIRDAPVHEDRVESTDLVLLQARPMTIAVRVRREGYLKDYPGQFTLRSARQSLQKTELAKVISGFGDVMFYGHAGPGDEIIAWYLIDLARLRQAFMLRPTLLHQPDDLLSGRQENRDGTEFMWFRADLIKPNVLMGASQ